MWVEDVGGGADPIDQLACGGKQTPEIGGSHASSGGIVSLFKVVGQK